MTWFKVMGATAIVIVAAACVTGEEARPAAARPVVELGAGGLQAGTTWVAFGTNDDDTVEAIRAVLGPPTKDTGWIEAWGAYGACPEPTMRAVEWGSLVTLFTTTETDFRPPDEPKHFFAYSYADNAPPHGLMTPEGIGVGSTLGELQAAYPGEITIDEAFFDPNQGTWSYRLESWTGLTGSATGQTAADTISSIVGGRGCGE